MVPCARFTLLGGRKVINQTVAQLRLKAHDVIVKGISSRQLTAILVRTVSCAVLGPTR